MFQWLEPVAICDQFLFLDISELESEFLWEAGDVSLNLFVQALVFDLDR